MLGGEKPGDVRAVVSESELWGVEDVHWSLVVRAQEADAFFCDLGQLQEGDHLETGMLVSSVGLSRCVSRLGIGTLHCLLSVSRDPPWLQLQGSGTCQDVVRP